MKPNENNNKKRFTFSSHANGEPALPPGTAGNQKWDGIHILVAVFHLDAPLLWDPIWIDYLGLSLIYATIINFLIFSWCCCKFVYIVLNPTISELQCSHLLVSAYLFYAKPIVLLLLSFDYDLFIWCLFVK